MVVVGGDWVNVGFVFGLRVGRDVIFLGVLGSLGSFDDMCRGRVDVFRVFVVGV